MMARPALRPVELPRQHVPHCREPPPPTCTSRAPPRTRRARSGSPTAASTSSASASTSRRGCTCIPRYRQRLAQMPLEGHPVWVDDEHFNIDYHVRHTALPRPGDERQLKRLSRPHHVAAARPREAALGDVGRRGPRGRRSLRASSPRCTTAWSTACRASTCSRCCCTPMPTETIEPAPPLDAAARCRRRGELLRAETVAPRGDAARDAWRALRESLARAQRAAVRPAAAMPARGRATRCGRGCARCPTRRSTGRSVRTGASTGCEMTSTT